MNVYIEHEEFLKAEVIDEICFKYEVMSDSDVETELFEDIVKSAVMLVNEDTFRKLWDRVMFYDMEDHV